MVDALIPLSDRRKMKRTRAVATEKRRRSSQYALVRLRASFTTRKDVPQTSVMRTRDNSALVVLCTCLLAGRPFVKFRVVPAVGEVDNQADSQPNDEPHPRRPRQRIHQVAARKYPQDRDHRDQGGPERSSQTGLLAAQHNDPAADQHESKQASRCCSGSQPQRYP